MRYQIYTIPIWDAVKEDTECPMCKIRENLEAKYLDVYLGGAVMEPDVRIITNEKGFCSKHFIELYKKQNRLPVGLMAHTRLVELTNKMDGLMQETIVEVKKPKRRGGDNSLNKLIDALDINANSCVICDRIDADIEKYIYTLLYMWRKEKEFKAAISESKGFCIEHFGQILKSAKKNLSKKEKEEFLPMIINLQRENLQRIEQEIKWFTDKFDYRNQKAPWGTSKDALPRTIEKLSGRKP